MNIDFARQQMIEQQIRAWDVLDTNVLDGLREVRRELFVPAGFETLAFADAGIPIGHGEVMMTPTIEGRVLQTLALAGGENVLEIGTGSGFLTACLARLSTHVTSIDIHDDFLDAARQRLDDCDIENVHLLRMNAMRELPEGTFDAIAVTGSIQTLDPRFANALAPGGRLFVIVGDSPAMAATRVTRIDEDKLQNDTMFEIDLAPLTNGALLPQFSF
ncbi:MAG: protein-L-isoaspartate O-methyltransferase [Woeseiaceae bacterium]|jgi:protein-L-isoaspartate(D-aspartate) O-methyltransferase|nr:protein-L-isoaspartate O-methyltransferase [Woeseiaceae bacterium]